MQNIVMLTQVKGKPQRPQGQKHPADVIANAVNAMQIGRGEEAEGFGADDSKEKAAQLVGGGGRREQRR